MSLQHSPFFGSQRSCVAISTPLPMKTGANGKSAYETISPRFMRAKEGLRRPTNLNSYEVVCDGLEVGVARSQVAAQTLAHKPPPEFLFFHDWDVLPSADALTKLFFRARCYPEIDLFAGVYCCKHSNPPDPLIYTENGQGAFWDWKVGDLLTTKRHNIRAVHMGLSLIRVSVFQKLKDMGFVRGDGTNMDDEPFFLTINQRDDSPGSTQVQMGTEDIYFCHKLMLAGCQIMVDTSVLAGHVDKETDIIYGLPYNDGPVNRTKWMQGPGGRAQDEQEAEAQIYEGPCFMCRGDVCPDCHGTGKVKRPFKLALDIGAGSERRVWPGYVTHTTDIRPDTKPDYIQDSRLLNLPPNHFDLVASCHHLEHIGRWEQTNMWEQMFNMLKPGGRIEHMVPSLDWATQKMLSGRVDGHVMDVLYGAQEDHGYAREHNTHFFGFTKEVAKALAQAAGFVDVEVKDWRDHPDLKYTMTIVARKPLSPEQEKRRAKLIRQLTKAAAVTEAQRERQAARTKAKRRAARKQARVLAASKSQPKKSGRRSRS